MPQHKVGYITSASNPLVVHLKKMARRNTGYRAAGEVLLEGEHLCRAWAERGAARALHAFISERAWQEGRHVELCAEASATTMVLADALMAEIGTLDSPAPVAFLVPLPRPEQLVADASTVVLDRLQDAGNAGSILRSAAAFGFGQIVALEGTVALWSPKVLRAAMGAHFSLRLLESADPAVVVESLRVPLFATSSHATDALDAALLPWPCAWVVGNEGAGVAPLVTQRCARTLRIPQPGGGESLNVAVAAAICLYASSVHRPPDPTTPNAPCDAVAARR